MSAAAQQQPQRSRGSGSGPPERAQQGPPSQAVQAPGGVVTTRSRSGRRRAAPAVPASARRIMKISVAAAVVSLLAGIAGFAVTQGQATSLSAAATHSGRVFEVMEIRGSVVTADGAATNAFLVGGLEPPERREAYDAAIADAASLLTGAAGENPTDAAILGRVNADLATYTALVEAARVNNRLGYPVGAAYLDQASTLVREEILVDLDEALLLAADRAAGDFSGASAGALVIVVFLGALAVIVVAQVTLARLTRRRLNPGLVVATVALAVGAIAGGGPAVVAGQSAGELRQNAYRDSLAVARAESLVTEARSLEAFTLIRRGSGGEFEEAYQQRVAEAAEILTGQEVADTGMTDALEQFTEAHAQIRELDDGGDWDGAVDLAVSDEPGSVGEAYRTFTDSTGSFVAQGRAEVADELSAAATSSRVASWLMLVTGVAGAIIAWRGTAARREEYR